MRLVWRKFNYQIKETQATGKFYTYISIEKLFIDLLNVPTEARNQSRWIHIQPSVNQ